MKNRVRIIEHGRIKMPEGTPGPVYEGLMILDSQEDEFLSGHNIQGFTFGWDDEE